MSPRTGRPTVDRKSHEKKIRLSDKDLDKLDYCSNVLMVPKAEIIRRGIDRIYEEAKQNAKNKTPAFPDQE